MLESLGGVPQAEGRKGVFKNAKSCGNLSLLNWDLLMRTHQVDFRVDGGTRKVMGVVLNVSDEVTIGDCAGI
jgi:hypothetical protein